MPCTVGQMATIGDLPDDVLLTMFDFYVVGYQDLCFIEQFFGHHDAIRSWQSLVQVCRRWRGLVFASPRRLKLQLYCTTTTPARKTLDVWPALPLIIRGGVSETIVDNVIAQLEHSDRICKINLLWCTNSQIEKLWAIMQAPFPELTILSLSFGPPSNRLVLPDLFLGGSAPRLRFLALETFQFPGLPKLLLSATHLVHLSLSNIPHSGYISPEAMVTYLSVLTSLEEFRLRFDSPQSCPDQETRRSPPPTRSILPALTFFSFKGVNEYLDDIVSRIDAPKLCRLSTTFFNDIDFSTPGLSQFINRTPTLGPYSDGEAYFIFGYSDAVVELHWQSHPKPFHRRMFEVKILCKVSDWQLSPLAQICALSLHPLLTMENLYIYEIVFPVPDWKDDTENSEWLNLLLPFTAVKNLYLSKLFSPLIAPALQELTGARTTEVLPALKNVLLEGFQPSEPVQEGIAQFISARQLIKCPVAISVWERPKRTL